MSMKLKFKSQKYQEDAVNSVVNVFKGQEYMKEEKAVIDRDFNTERLAFVNPKVCIGDPVLLESIKSIQEVNNKNYPDGRKIVVNDSLDKDQNTKCLNLTIEMETGTGKTYVYIKTIHELYQKYRWKKFIVMVPNIAIREGVLKTFQITEEHFREIYNQRINFWIFDNSNSSNLANLGKFSSGDGIHVIIMNYQSFSAQDQATRRIFQHLDQTNSDRPIDLIKITRPIIILDEPQRFGTSTLQRIVEFNPNFILRYSATHREIINKVYKIDAVDAIKKNLVKKIDVLGIKVHGVEGNTPFLYLDSIVINRNSPPFARFEIDTINADGKPIRKIVKANYEDDLYLLSNNNSAYKNGYKITQIDGGNDKANKVSFGGNDDITVGEVRGSNEVVENMVRTLQIRRTIREHLDKERRLFKKGIKVLSLFFIDTVAKYRVYEENIEMKGEYAEIFEREYQNEVNYILMDMLEDENYKNYLSSTPDEVHGGYFSIDKKSGRLRDPEITGGISKNSSDYDLIMKNKERLLSFDEPKRFIFSHSALREGWDNPNVFQICTLKVAQQGDSKRQEIGRGLRICVNSINGDRMDEELLGNEFRELNKLTVIASESYRSYVEKLQKEYTADGYSDDDVETPGGGDISQRKVPIKTNSNFKNTKFQKLWDSIRYKNSYTVNFDSNELINESIKGINESLHVDTILIQIDGGEVIGIFHNQVPPVMGGIMVISPEFTEDMEFNKYDLVKEITNRTQLTRKSIVKILKSITSNKFNMFKINPIQFINNVSKIINEVKARILVNGIEFFTTSEKYDESIFKYFKPEDPELPSNMLESKKHIADFLPYDSETERKFAEDLEGGDIEVFAKLPREFKIPTPAGNYNPDWAIVMRNRDERNTYFITETKGYESEVDMSEAELLKLRYSKKLFNSNNKNLRISGVKYIVAMSDYPYLDFINKINS